MQLPDERVQRPRERRRARQGRGHGTTCIGRRTSAVGGSNTVATTYAHTSEKVCGGVYDAAVAQKACNIALGSAKEAMCNGAEAIGCEWEHHDQNERGLCGRESAQHWLVDKTQCSAHNDYGNGWVVRSANCSMPNDSKIDKDRYMLGRGGQRMYQGIMIGKGTSYCHVLNGTKASITYESGQGAPLWSTDIHTCDDNMHNAVAAHAGRKNKTSNDDLTDTGRAKVFLALEDGQNAAAQKNAIITHLTTYDDGGIPLRQTALPDKALDQCVGDGKNGDHFDPHDCGNCDANFMLLNAERFSEEGSRDVSKHWSTSRGVAK